MVPSALDHLSADHFSMLYLADRIEQVLARPATSIHLQHVAYELIDANDRLIRPHLAREEHVLLAVLREHAGESPALEEARLQAALISENMRFLRQAVELGHNLRSILEDVEWCLRAYVDHEEKHVIPWADEVLGKALMAEVERRFEEAIRPRAFDVKGPAFEIS